MGLKDSWTWVRHSWQWS